MKSLLRTTLLLFGMAGLLAPLSARAQLLEVDQTVYGMDCTPCAYALDKLLHKIDGVAATEVSLETGSASVTLDPANAVTLSDIREAVKQGGFMPKESVVRISGTLVQEGGHLYVQSGAGERFLIAASPSQQAVRDTIQKTPAGTRITVAGRVAEGEADAGHTWMLHVVEV